MSTPISRIDGRVQPRRNTVAGWTASNSILYRAEIGVEIPDLVTDSAKIKIGDGVTPWNSLPYFATSPSGATNLDALTDVILTAPAAGRFLRHNGTTFVDGPIQSSDIPAGLFTNANAANMATKTYKGRTSALTGVPEDVPVLTLRTDINDIANVKYYSNNLTADKAAIGAVQTVFRISSNLVVSSSDSIPLNMVVEFEGDGRITTTNALDTVTINKLGKTDGTQRFFGPGKVVLGFNATNQDIDMAMWVPTPASGLIETTLTQKMWDGIKESASNSNGATILCSPVKYLHSFEVQAPLYATEIHGYSSTAFLTGTVFKQTTAGLSCIRIMPGSRSLKFTDFGCELPLNDAGSGFLLEGNAATDAGIAGVSIKGCTVHGGRSPVRIKDTNVSKNYLVVEVEIIDNQFLNQSVGSFECNSVNTGVKFDLNYCNPLNNGVADIFHCEAIGLLMAGGGNNYAGYQIGNVHNHVFRAPAASIALSGVITAASALAVKNGDPVYVYGGIPPELSTAKRYFLHIPAGTPTLKSLHLTASEAIGGTNRIAFTTSGGGTMTVASMRPILVYSFSVAAAAVNVATNAFTGVTWTEINSGTLVYLTTTGTVPGGLALATPYYVHTELGTLHTSSAAAIAGTGAIDITSQGTGTHTLAFGRPRAILYLNGQISNITMIGNQGEGMAFNVYVDSGFLNDYNNPICLINEVGQAVSHFKKNAKVVLYGGKHLARSFTDEIGVVAKIENYGAMPQQDGAGGPYITASGHNVEYPYPLDNFLGGNSGVSGSIFENGKDENGYKMRAALEVWVPGSFSIAHPEIPAFRIIQALKNLPSFQWEIEQGYGGVNEKKWWEWVEDATLLNGWARFLSSNGDAVGLKVDGGLVNSGRTGNLKWEALTSAATISLDAIPGSQRTLTLAHTATLNIANTANIIEGQDLFIEVTGNGSPFVLTFGAGFTSYGTFSTIASEITTLCFKAKGTSFREVGRRVIAAVIGPRIGTIASSATPTPDSNANDQYNVTALAVGATFAAPTGTPVDGQALTIRIKDNAASQTLAYNAIYRAIGVTLPTATTISKTIYLIFKYNLTDTKWDCIEVRIEI